VQLKQFPSKDRQRSSAFGPSEPWCT